MPRKRKARSAKDGTATAAPADESSRTTSWSRKPSRRGTGAIDASAAAAAASSSAPLDSSGNASSDLSESLERKDALRSIAHQVSFIPILEHSSVVKKSGLHTPSYLGEGENGSQTSNQLTYPAAHKLFHPRSIGGYPSKVAVNDDIFGGCSKSNSQQSNNNAAMASNVLSGEGVVLCGNVISAGPFSHVPLTSTNKGGGMNHMGSVNNVSHLHNPLTEDILDRIGLPQWEQVQTLLPPGTIIPVSKNKNNKSSKPGSRRNAGHIPIGNRQHNSNYRQQKINSTTIVIHEGSSILAMADDIGRITAYSISPLVLPMKSYDTHASTLEPNPIPISQLSFSNNGKYIICGSMIGLEILDLQTGRPIALWTGFDTLLVERFASVDDERKDAQSRIDDNDGERHMVRMAPTKFDPYPTHEYGNGEEIVKDVQQHASFLVSFTFDFAISKRQSKQHVHDGIKGEMPLDTCNSSPLVLIQPKLKIPEESGTSERDWVWNCDMEPIIPKERQANSWRDVPVGSKAIAMWDRSNPKNIIALYLVRDDCQDISATDAMEDDESKNESSSSFRQELILFDYETRRLRERIVIPHKGSGLKISSCDVINQSPRGRYTLVGTTGLTNNGNGGSGIRLYQTDDLLHLMSFGGISLHGNQLAWQDCFFANLGMKDETCDNDGTTSSSTESGHNYQERWGRIIEIPDEMLNRGHHQQRYGKELASNTGKEESIHDLHIVTVPYSNREPIDLKDKIHFWDLLSMPVIPESRKFTDNDVVVMKSPSFTMKAPTKSYGIYSLLFDTSVPTLYGGRFFVTTLSGEIYHLTPKMISDFAGQMFPPGYLSIEDNVMYIEDEDELDKVVTTSNVNNTSASTMKDGVEVDSKEIDTDLEMALRMSIATEEDNMVIDVFGDGDSGMEVGRKLQPSVIPCRPESHLREELKRNDDKIQAEKSEGRGNIGGIASVLQSDSSFFALFPQKKEVDEFVDGIEDRETKRNKEMQETLKKLSERKNTKPAKKSRSANAMVNNFVNEALYKAMVEKERFADGSGSTISSKLSTSQCLACSGRFVIHTCGNFAAPKDLEAIAEAEREKAEAEARKKKELQAEKRRVAARKREIKRQKEKKEKELAERQRKEKEEELKQSQISSSLQQDTIANQQNGLVAAHVLNGLVQYQNNSSEIASGLPKHEIGIDQHQQYEVEVSQEHEYVHQNRAKALQYQEQDWDMN